MKRWMLIMMFMWGGVLLSYGQGNPGLTAESRAQTLSDEMIRELRLNNYQARKLRALNLELAKDWAVLEKEYGHDPKVLAEKCDEACQQKYPILQSFLSNDQYNQFFGNRTRFYQRDNNTTVSATEERLNVNQDPAGKGVNATVKDAVKVPQTKKGTTSATSKNQ